MPKHFTSLELHGYKTFANQTEFKLPGMVTAIVGPNGSGKSNIADAVRWVLGEQSYTLLRAKKTEDMIFAGSEQRSRAGFASVSIAFDNEDGWLPIDYTEVVLTRRAYRDGQNEYLINNQKVRLKDFHELLASTGLGDRNYSIIGQGLVDVALAIKPDERRKLFEEAAGINLYRERKEESLKRLDASQRNLERVLDILTEIKPRLRSLERQAAKASEFRRLQNDLQAHLRDWYGYYWFTAQEDLLKAKNAYKDFELKVTETKKRQLGIADEIKRYNLDLQVKREEINHYHSELANLHKEIEGINLKLAILYERDLSLKSVINDLENRRIAIDEGLVARKKETQDIVTLSTGLQMELDELSSQCEGLKQELLKKRSERSKVESQLTELRQKQSVINTKLVNLNARESETRDRVTELVTTIDRSDKQLDSINQHLLKVEGELAQRLEAARQKQVTRRDFIAQLSRLTGQTDQLNSRLERLKNTINGLENDKARLNTRLDLINRSEQAMEDLSQGAKSLLLKAPKIDLALQAINKELIVPEKFELAIASALSDSIDILRLKNKNLNIDILNVIEPNISGRVAIINHDGEKTFYNDFTLPPGTPVIGKASDLIEFPHELRGVVETLLSRVLVVQDKQAAFDVIQVIPPYYKVVTLQGDLFLGKSIIYLGKSGNTRKIGQPREKQEMKAKVLSLEEEILGLLQEQQSLLVDMGKLNAEKGDVRKDQERLEEEVNKDQLLINNLEVEKSKLTEQVNWHTTQKQNSTEKLAELQKNLALMKQESEKFQFEERAVKDQIKERQDQLVLIPLDELQSNVYRYESDMAILKAKLHNTKLSLDGVKSQVMEGEKNLLEMTTRLDQSKKQSSEIERQNQQYQEELAQKNKLITELQSNRSGNTEDQFTDLEGKLSRLQLTEADLQRDYLVKERQFTQASLDLTLKTDKLENLKQRIEDDFGMVEFDYIQNIEGSTPLPFKDLIIESLKQKVTLPETLGEEIKDLKNQLRRIGSINPEALAEYDEVKQRYTFLDQQVKDLEKASTDLRKVIEELDEIMARQFLSTFKLVNEEFSKMFTRLFNGGSARLSISDESQPIESGIEIEAKLPGRREQGLASLSGGERSLAASALIFALQKVSPTPFCILDEVDAMLDESNVGRFCDLLLELSEVTQFIIITHNRTTVQVADIIYGVTMGRDSSTQVLSLRLDEVDQSYVE